MECIVIQTDLMTVNRFPVKKPRQYKRRLDLAFGEHFLHTYQREKLKNNHKNMSLHKDFDAVSYRQSFT